MLTVEELMRLLSGESDRVERTRSTTDTDKFAQAVCAFANDFPCHRQPGYLLIGVGDDGKTCGLTVTDQLLVNLGGLRSDGNIQRAQALLSENGNPPAEFVFDDPHAVLVIVRRRPA